MTAPVYSAPNTAAPATPLLAVALDLAACGLPVFPLAPRSKDPYAAGHRCRCKTPHKNGCKDATTNEAAIRDWWQNHPTANIGYLPPFLLDVDSNKPGAADWLAARPGLPPTPRVRTGSGGAHYLFADLPGGPWHNNAKLCKGVDVRDNSGKGYAVAAGSIHPNGTPYQWEPGAGLDDLPLAPVPDWLREELTAALATPDPPPLAAPATSATDSATPQRAARIIDKALARVVQEGRNEAGLWAALQLRDNRFSESEAEYYLAQFWRQARPHGNHPYKWTDVQATIKQVYSRAPRAPWEDRPRPALDPLDILTQLDPPPPAPPPVLQQQTPPPVPVLDGGADPVTGEIGPPDAAAWLALVNEYTRVVAERDALAAQLATVTAQQARRIARERFYTGLMRLPNVDAADAKAAYYLRLLAFKHADEIDQAGWFRVPMWEYGALMNKSAKEAGRYAKRLAAVLYWAEQRKERHGANTVYIYMRLHPALLGDDPALLPLPAKSANKGGHRPRRVCVECGHEDLYEKPAVWVCKKCQHEQTDLDLADAMLAGRVPMVEVPDGDGDDQADAPALADPPPPAPSNQIGYIDPHLTESNQNGYLPPPAPPSPAALPGGLVDTRSAAAIHAARAAHQQLHPPPLPDDAPPAWLDAAPHPADPLPPAAAPPVEPYRPGALAAAPPALAARPMHTPGCGGVGLHDCPACLQADPADPDP